MNLGISIYKKILSNPIFASIKRTIDIDGVEHAGYMSFMVLLSFFPFLVFFLALTSKFGNSDLGIYLIQFIVEKIPKDSEHYIKNSILEVASTPPKNLLTLAIVGNVWTSSSFVECLRTILNRIYNVQIVPTYLARRLLSIFQFILLNLLLYGTIFVLVLIPAVIGNIAEIDQFFQNLSFLSYIRYFLIILFLFFTVSMFYYAIPNIKISYYEVIPGSIVTVILWVISGFLLNEYTQYNNLMLIYGSLWNIIITLIFFYIINMLFIYGAVLNHMIFRKNGSEGGI
jgi:membrane protein